MKFRHEYKYRINLSDMMALEHKLSAICKYDIHSEDDGSYLVKSLYFDNYANKALREKLAAWISAKSSKSATTETTPALSVLRKSPR